MPLTKANPDPRPLPLIADILESIDDSSDLAYVVYSNADIGLMPHFYLYCALVSAGSRLPPLPFTKQRHRAAPLPKTRNYQTKDKTNLK